MVGSYLQTSHNEIRVESKDAPVPDEHVVVNENGLSWHPTWIPHTDSACYLTAMSALNLQSAELGPRGDWHHAMWQCPTEGVTAHSHEAQTSKTPRYARACAEINALLGERELADARAALRAERHPAGQRNEVVWSATHVRAIIETAWRDAIEEAAAKANPAEHLIRAVSPHAVRRWLGTQAQWTTLHEIAKEVRDTLAEHHAIADAWEQWRIRLSPQAHYARPDVRWGGS